jgi:hypothetical protein
MQRFSRVLSIDPMYGASADAETSRNLREVQSKLASQMSDSGGPKVKTPAAA